MDHTPTPSKCVTKRSLFPIGDDGRAHRCPGTLRCRRSVGPDFKHKGFVVGAILQVMPIRFTGLETNTITCLEHLVSRIGDQNHFATSHASLRSSPTAVSCN